MALQSAAAQKRLGQTIEQAVRTQRTTPIGWGLAVWLVWDAVPMSAVLTWLALFLAALLVILMGLHRLQKHRGDYQRSLTSYTLLTGLDGLAWGMLSQLLLGHDRVVDTWLVTLLCGVAAVNAPVHLMFMRALALQYLGIFVPTALHFLLQTPGQDGLRMTIGMGVFLLLLLYYMNNVGRTLNNHVLLTLQNKALAAQLKAALSTVEIEAATDLLTSAPNRRALLQVLERQRLLYDVHQTPFAVLMLDIDHFKQINDRHGHGIGDEALKSFCGRVTGALRPSDTLARYGGEEFVAVIPSTRLEAALHAAQRVCDAVAASPLLSAPSVPATVSIGVAAWRPGMTIEQLLESADRAVYAAKRQGRNRVCAASEVSLRNAA